MTPTSQPAGSIYLKTSSPPPSQPCTFSNLSAAPPYYGPPIQQVLNQIEADKPGQGFSELEETLGEAGLVSSCQVVILSEDVVSVIGNMGAKKARILCNYAKCAVLPSLGLQGNHDNPEIASPMKDTEGNGIMESGLCQVRDLWNIGSVQEHGNKEGNKEYDDETEGE